MDFTQQVHDDIVEQFELAVMHEVMFRALPTRDDGFIDYDQAHANIDAFWRDMERGVDDPSVA